MLELLWTEDGEDTRYKVLFPITTPLLSLNLQVFDSESHIPLSYIVIICVKCKLTEFLISRPYRYCSKAASV